MLHYDLTIADRQPVAARSEINDLKRQLQAALAENADLKNRLQEAEFRAQQSDDLAKATHEWASYVEEDNRRLKGL